MTDSGSATVRVSGLELGGLCGSLVAGKISDARVAAAREGQGKVGLRIQVFDERVSVSLISFFI